MQVQNIPPSKIKVGTFLANGGFGTVFKGTYAKDPSTPPLQVNLNLPSADGCLRVESPCVHNLYVGCCSAPSDVSAGCGESHQYTGLAPGWRVGAYWQLCSRDKGA